MVVAIVVALAQLFGPSIAASVVKGKVGRYGTVKSVTVKAWPALQLLWHHADEVNVNAEGLTFSSGQTVALLKEGVGTDTIHARADAVIEDGLRLTDVRFEKYGMAMRAEGTVSEADIVKVLPSGVTVALLGSERGTIRVRVGGGLFGVGVNVDAVVKADGGKLVVQPVGLLSGLKVTLFADPDVYVEGVQAQALGAGRGGREERYELVMWAKLT